MDKISVIYAHDNMKAQLAFSQSMLLLHTNCTLTIRENPYESPEARKFNQFSGWTFVIVFTDNSAPGDTPSVTRLSVDHDKKIAIIMCYRWFGENLENTKPIIVESEFPKKSFLIKIKSTAFQTTPDRRKLDITIWTKI